MAKLIFNATKEQIQLAGALAANEAEPVGLGMLHYRPEHEFTPEEMEAYWIDDKKDHFQIDYAEGRCTKFSVWKADQLFHSDDVSGYEWMTGADTQSDYETWNSEYPTYEDLLRAAGITDMKRIGE